MISGTIRKENQFRIHIRGILLIVFLLYSLYASGQWNTQLGLKAGLIRSTLKIDEQQLSSNAFLESTPLLRDGEFGYLIGVYFLFEKELTVGNMQLRPEIIFERSSSIIKYRDQVGTPNETLTNIKEEFKNLNLPLSLGYRLAIFGVYAGPVFSFLLASDSDFEKRDGFSRSFEGFNTGYRLGASLNIDNMSFDFFFQQIGHVDEPLTIDGLTFDLRSRQLQVGFSLAVMLDL